MHVVTEDVERRRTTRRRFLWWTGGAVGVIGLAAAGGATWLGVTVAGSRLDTVGQVDFRRRLAIPDLAPSRVEDGVRIFELTMQTGFSDLGQAATTPTWGVNGALLGPTLRMRRDEQVLVHVTNRLPETSTLHWHGMHLPAEMDGGPHQPIESGQTWSPTWQVHQPAATLWYHPHPHGSSAHHVYRGISGSICVDDDSEQSLNLPRTYGVDDLPIIIQDRKFLADGSLDESRSFLQSDGIIGDTIMVNGTVGPFVDVVTQDVRLRILNGSNTRPYHLAFEDRRTFAMIASDGGLLSEPVALQAIQLSPGERAENCGQVRSR